MAIELLLLWVGLGSCLLVALCAIIMVLRFRARLQGTQQELMECIAKLDQELAVLLDAGHGMGQQVRGLQDAVKETEQRLLQLEQRDLGALPYNEAVRMVANGADADQLVTQCGLSRAEADLVLLLHKRSPPTLAPLYEQQPAAVSDDVSPPSSDDIAQSASQQIPPAEEFPPDSEAESDTNLPGATADDPSADKNATHKPQ